MLAFLRVLERSDWLREWYNGIVGGRMQVGSPGQRWHVLVGASFGSSFTCMHLSTYMCT